MTLKLDEANRVELPEKMRAQFALKPGDELEVIVEADGIRLRPAIAGAPLKEENGLLVCSSKLPAKWDMERFLDEQRELRAKELAGI